MRSIAILIISGLLAGAAYAQAPAGGMGTLPPGHPNIENVPPPATQPVQHGGIAIRALQGTQDGPAVANDPVTIELYYQNRPIRKIDTKLDEKGVVVVEGLPMSMPFEPVVTVKHGGVDYQARGHLMDARHPEQKLEVLVYETTEKAPEWRLHMRHVVLDPLPDGLRVTEVLAVENSSDRTWIGTPRPDGSRATLTLDMPQGIEELQLGGDLHDCCVKAEGNKLINTMALQPGMSQMQMVYFIPGKDGQANFSVKAPAPVKRMLLMAPENAASLKVTGLEAAPARETGKGSQQTFRGADLAAGAEVAIVATLPQAAASAAHSQMPKVIAGIGAGLILVVGAAIILLKSPKKA